MRTKDNAVTEDLAPDLQDLLSLLPRVAPGKRTRAERLPARPSSELPPHTEAHGLVVQAAPAAVDPFGVHLTVQQRATGPATADVHTAAASGLAEPASSLPFLDEIQNAFGPAHDLRGIQAHVGGAASAAAAAMGASAYAAGDHVAFAGAPDLHTAAHEAAHVIQQRAGVSLSGGVGAVGDSYERNADAVADAVVRGESAAALLGGPAPGAASAGAVQRKAISPLAATAVPDLEASPPVVHLRGGVVGKSRSAQIQITNREPATIELVDLLTTPAGLQGWIIGPRTLEPDQSTIVTITYEPTTAGSITGKITLITFDGAGFDIPVEADAKAFGPQLPPPAPKPAAPAAPKTRAPDAPVAPVDDEPAGASFATPSPLIASPADLRFDDDTKGDVGTLLTLVNQGSDPVTIDSVSISGGEPGFGATLVGDTDLIAGAATSVVVDYRAASYTSRPASLEVITSDGGVLLVPIRGPRIGSLDVLPAVLTLESEVSRQTEFASVVLRNRSRTAVEIHSIDFASPAEHRPFRLGTQRIERIAPGAEAVLLVSFMSSTPGTHDDSLSVVGTGGKVFASIPIHGIAHDTSKPADPITDAPPSDESCPTDDAETKTARTAARTALDAWTSTSHTTITDSYKTLADEWGRYLKFTGLNPSISRASLPDPSIIRSLLSNAFGNTLTAGPLNPTKLRVPTARGVAGAIAGAVTDDVAVAAGLLAGGGVGLVVGVLVETLAGVIFDQLVGDDDAARKAAQDLYDQGRADGGLQVGQRIIDRQQELAKGQGAARAALKQQHEARAARISEQCDAGALREVIRMLDAETAAALSTSAVPGIASQELLAIWARDHAAATTKAGTEVVRAQWENVTEELSKADKDHFAKGKIKNQPELFVSQCTREWESRGLRIPPELQESIREGFEADPEQMAKPENGAYFAMRLQRKFDEREFVWDQSSVKWGVLSEGLPRANEGTHDDWENVSCRPSLTVENGSCIVTSFRYRIQTGGGVLEASTRPGNPRWHVPDTRPGDRPSAPPPHAQARELLAVLDQLEQAGFTVRQEADAASNEWLKGTFGEHVARPATQHADGRDEPISVFRIVGTVGNVVVNRASATCPDDRKPLTPALAATLQRFTRIDEGPYSLFRGGNTILVLERCDAR